VTEVVFRRTTRRHARVLRLQLVGTVAFAVLIGGAFNVWRRDSAGQCSREHAGVLIAGTFMLGIWVVALALTLMSRPSLCAVSTHPSKAALSR